MILMDGTRQSIKVSRGVFYRAGTIEFAQEPELHYRAQELLQTEPGEEAFRERYGDYYVAAMTIGGDSGAFMSVDAGTKTTTDTVALTVTVKVLFFKAKSWSTSKTTTKVEHDLSFTFCGYDTLEGTSTTMKPGKPTPLDVAQTQVTHFVDLADSLETRTAQKLFELRIEDKHGLTMSQCEVVCRSGVVVQLLLAPFERLMGYKRAVAGRDSRVVSKRFM